jgi:uncharacterized glyoxalase superfamily protein PhnB
MERTMQNKPHRFGELTPYFTVTDADYFITFLSEVFAAKIVKDSRYEDGTLQHARLQIGDSLIMLNQANHQPHGEPRTSTIAWVYEVVSVIPLGCSNVLSCAVRLSLAIP